MGLAAIAGAIADPSLLAKIFGFQPILIGPAGDELTIDILQEETPNYQFQITRDPVESGCDITDHIQENPVTLTLDCIFTDMQFSAKAIVSGLLNGNLSLATWRDKKDVLYKMKDAAALVNVSTPLHFYQNYLIESISPTSTLQSGDCFRCRISLVSVNLVASMSGVIDPSLVPVDMQSAATSTDKADAAKGKGQGNKGPAPTEAAGGAKGGKGGTTADAYAF